MCGADIRRENEGYDLFIGQHERGELLPDAADVERLEDEAILALAHEIKNGAGSWIADSRAHPYIERRVVLLGGATLRLFCAPSEGSNATWVAIPTLLADELGLPESVRALIVAAVTEALEGAAAAVDWEQRHDWPTGPLQHFEVAYFWLS